MFEVKRKKLMCSESSMFAVELLVNSAVVCIVALSFQKHSPEVFYKKNVLRNFTKFTGKHLCQSLFINKVAGLRPATLLKKRLLYRCFPVNFVKLLRTLFYRTPLDGCFCVWNMPRYFTFHILVSLELYDNWFLLKLLAIL